MLLAGVLASSISVLPVRAQSPASAVKPPAAAAPPTISRIGSQGAPAGITTRLGVDSLSVKWANRARSFDLHSVCWMR